MTINFKQCPKCSSKNAIPIEYGLPGSDMFNKAKEGKVKLGGCCVDEGSPEFYCQDCKYEWDKVEVVDKAYQKIKGIKASVGGYFGASYLVEINLLNGNISWIKWEQGEKIDTYNRNIKPETVKRFIEDLKSVNLLGWKYKYVEPNVCDGTGWRVEIYREGRDLVKSGSNAYPDEWDAFCSIIGKVVGRKFR